MPGCVNPFSGMVPECKITMKEREVCGAGCACPVFPKSETKNMTSLPPSSKTVLRLLSMEGAMTHKDIVNKSNCKSRTVRYALKKLKEYELITAKANLQDMRQIIYQNRNAQRQETGTAKSISGSYQFLKIPTSAE